MKHEHQWVPGIDFEYTYQGAHKTTHRVPVWICKCGEMRNRKVSVSGWRSIERGMPDPVHAKYLKEQTYD